MQPVETLTARRGQQRTTRRRWVSGTGETLPLTETNRNAARAALPQLLALAARA